VRLHSLHKTPDISDHTFQKVTLVSKSVLHSDHYRLAASNGGTDPSMQQCAPWQGTQPRATVTRSTAAGFIESWNHGMVCVGRDLKDHLVPTPLL